MSTPLKVLLWIVVVIVIAYAALYVAGSVLIAKDRIEDERRYPLPVKYVVTCDECDLTYSNGTGGTDQIEVKTKWEKEFDGDKGQHLYLSAQNQYSGPVDVKIYVEGVLTESGHAEGRHKIASASGSVK